MAKKIFLRDENNVKVLPITRGELILDSSGNPAFHSNEFLATDSQPGLMSPDDKQKLANVAGNTIDTELSNTSTNPVQNKVLTQIINSIREKYLKSAVVSGNKITITDQSDNTVEFVNSTYQIVTNAVDGLVPKYDAVDGTIDAQTTDWVLTNHNGTLGWYKLPTTAFSSSSVQLFVGAKSTSNNNNSNSATTNGNTYLKLFDNSTLKNQYNIKGTGLTTVISDASGTITINTPTSHNQASSDINSLAGYTKATGIAAIATSDSLNTALGKLELKADTTYELVKGAYDGDGTIENLAEILKVLEGIKDTETIQAIIGKYLPLTGGTLTNDNNILNLSGTTNSYIYYRLGSTNKASSGYYENFAFIANEKTYARIGVADDGTPQYHTDNHKTNVYTLLHSGNSSVSLSGQTLTVKINGVEKSLTNTNTWYGDGLWAPSTNVTLNASANNQEWSFDIYRNSKTGCHWHVWDSSLGTMLKVNADDGKVSAPYGFVGNLNGNATYANSAGNADTLDGYHWLSFVTAGVYDSCNVNTFYNRSYVGSLYASSNGPAGNSIWYNVVQIAHRNGEGDGSSYISQIAIGMTSAKNRMWFRGLRTDSWTEVISSANIGSQSVNYASYARYVYCTSGSYLNFQWSGQSGQPTWLFGSNDGANVYVWNPSNFSVNYANSAGSATKATQDGNGNTISSYYVTLSTDQTITGKKTYSNVILFSDNDSYGIRTATNNYVRIGESSYRFYQCYVSSYYATSGFYQDSDIRLKNILQNVEVNLDDLAKLQKVYYTWKSGVDTNTHIGMIAQEVQKLYPELVNTDEETGYLSLAYDQLSVIALKAIDKLYAMIKDIQSENKYLKERLNQLENRIS